MTYASCTQYLGSSKGTLYLSSDSGISSEHIYKLKLIPEVVHGTGTTELTGVIGITDFASRKERREPV